MTQTQQIVTPAFAAWLSTTSFAGIVHPGDTWNTETAWPSRDTMEAAEACFIAFAIGDLRSAEHLMHAAQEPFV
jgi:hypothetical protein